MGERCCAQRFKSALTSHALLISHAVQTPGVQAGRGSYQHLSHEQPSWSSSATQLYSTAVFRGYLSTIGASIPPSGRGSHLNLSPQRSSAPQPRLEAGAADGAVQPEHVKDLVGALGHEKLLLVLA